MKFEIGDEILVIQTSEEGRIVEAISEDMYIVEVRGVKFPIYKDQIDFPYFKRFTQKKLFPSAKPDKTYIDQVPVEKKTQTNDIKTEDGIWLSFIPKFIFDEFGDDLVDYFKIYLVNHTSDGLRFYYRQEANNHVDFELKSEILPHKDVYLHDLDFSKLNESPLFNVEFSLIKPDKKKAEYFETELKLKPKQVFHKVQSMKEENKPTLSYKLLDIYPDAEKEEKKETSSVDLSKLKNAGFKIYSAHEARSKMPPARSVVDLHIEKLTDSWQQLSNLEILSIQLAEFEKWFDLAAHNHLPSFIVIHGVGKGKLKEEIHEILKNKPEVKSFVNQYDARFGYGATEIFFN